MDQVLWMIEEARARGGQLTLTDIIEWYWLDDRAWRY